MRIAFLTLYDQSAYGARHLAAGAIRAGHDAHLIAFKRFLPKGVSREIPEERHAIEASGHRIVYEVHPFHDMACPYPSPVTQREKELLFFHIEELRAEIVCFSLTSAHLPLAFELSGELRRRFPRVKQVWGGIHPSMDPKGCLQYADAVCVGEGDEALLEYLSDPNRTSVRNFWFRDGNDSLVTNPARPLIQNLDSLPTPLFGEHETLIDNDAHLGMTDFSAEGATSTHLVISSQRGCPFRCSYCLHGVMRDGYPGQKYLRRKSVDAFLDEIKGLAERFHLPSLFFWDEIFMIGPEWIEEFCDKYPKRIGLPFGGYAHPNTTPRPMLEALRKAGCEFIGLGIQSGSPYISKEIYNRHIQADKTIRFGRDMVETGYRHFAYDLLTNCPFERDEDCRATALLLAQMPKPANVLVKQVVFYPFTRIASLQRPHGGLSDGDFLFYNMLYLLTCQTGFDPALLATLVDDARLRAEPKRVEQWVQELAAAGDRAMRLEEENATLRARVDDLEKQTPWGVRRSAQWLLRETVKWFRR